jgi:hypothetical protein
LNSVPLHKQDATELLDSLEPYFEWQSDPAYKAHPPPSYFYPPHDIFATYNNIRSKLANDQYKNEYAWHEELYATVFGRAHDG